MDAYIPHRFLIETGSVQELEPFLEHSFRAFELCHVKQKRPLTYAHLCNSAGVLYHMTGRFQQSRARHMESHDIRIKLLPEEDREELAVTFNNLGNVSESEDRPLEAIEWHAKAKEIRSTLGPRAKVAVAYTTLNMSRALVMLDRHEEARQCLSETLSLFGTEISWFYLA